jgi:hypothetical protein
MPLRGKGPIRARAVLWEWAKFLNCGAVCRRLGKSTRPV